MDFFIINRDSRISSSILQHEATYQTRLKLYAEQQAIEWCQLKNQSFIQKNSHLQERPEVYN